MILELDTVLQSERFDAVPAAQAVAQITGMIRAALLVSDRILVTDTMILDGVYFAHMPPDALAQALGMTVHELPITVVCGDGASRGTNDECRVPTLAQALGSRLSNVAFIWQLHKHLDIDQMKAHWAAWTQPDLPFGREPYGKLEPFRPLDDECRKTLSPAAVGYLEAIEGIVKRSEVNAVEFPEDSDDVRSIRQWWETSYLLGIAGALRSDWLRFDAPQIGPDWLGRTVVPGRRQLHISADLATTTATMTSAIYGSVRYVTRRQRAALCEKPSLGRMKNLTYAIQQFLGGAGRIRDLVSAVTRLMIALLAVFFMLPMQPGWVPASPLLWVGIAIAAAATVPWDAVETIFKTAARQDAIMSFYSGAGS